MYSDKHGLNPRTETSPEFTSTCLLQLKWELGSPVLGMLLRKYAPTDTYEVAHSLPLMSTEEQNAPFIALMGHDTSIFEKA